MNDTEIPEGPKPAPSTHRWTMRALVTASLLSAIAAGSLGFLVAQRHGKDGPSLEHGQGTNQVVEKYTCAMHPTIVQDHPGDCPICGMKLVKMQSSSAPNAGASTNAPSVGGGERKVLFYRSPMDPKQTSPTPRKDEMGMDYVPVYADEMSDNAPPVAGLAAIDIDPARQQLIGLSTAEAKQSKVGGAWRTVGRVVVDETRVHHVNLKVAGFVERIYVDFIGKQVNKGQPLFTLYSPELLAAQDEYLLALKSRGILSATGANPDSDDTLVNASRRRLALWDLPEKTLDQIVQTRQATKTITFYSPASGVITKKDIVQGMKLDAGAMPYEIVDLSTVWVVADVYESELRFVKAGMPATLTLNAFPNREFNGKTVFIDPMLDPMTRTVKVRITFPNPTKELKPEMFGEVVLKGLPHDGVTVPIDAVIDSGTTHVVFVAVGNGKFRPRLVRLGDSDDTQVEIVSGLAAGEKVVTRANFLVDSESRLRASLAELAGGASRELESARVLPATDSPAALPATDGPAVPTAQESPPAAPIRSPAVVRKTPPPTPVQSPMTHEGHQAHESHEAHGAQGGT